VDLVNVPFILDFCQGIFALDQNFTEVFH